MTKFYLNQLVKNLPPSGIRRFFDLVISAGPEVISLGVGEPDFSTPWHVRESVIYSLEKGFTNYSENAGLFELRSEVAQFTADETGETYDPKTEILITHGVSEGMDLVFRSVLEPGEVVLVPDPGYVMYEPLVILAGGRVEFYDPLKIKDLKVPKNTKAIVLNFPGNPMGNTFSSQELQRVANLAQQHDFLVLSDEIYGGLTFEGQHKSILKFPHMRERAVYFNGLSKTHAMTGFRVGWVCGPSEIVGGMTRIHQYSALCVGTPSQVAALEALRKGDEEAESMRKIFDQRRKYCVSRLEKMGLEFVVPGGAFYIFADVSEHEKDDVKFCEELLKEKKLAIVPGSAFGSAGKGRVRMTYASSREELEEAMDRLEDFIGQ